MAVEIVRRAVDLVSLGHRRDLDALENAVPGYVDDRDVHSLGVEERPELTAAEQEFAGRDRRARAAPDQRQRLRIVGVDLQPHQIVGFDRARHLEIPSVLKLKLRSSSRSTSSPAPSRNAAIWSLMIRRRRRSTLSSGQPSLRAKPGWCMYGRPWSKQKMLVLSALKPRSRTSAPSALMSSSER